jgi:hypothetical protein
MKKSLIINFIVLQFLIFENKNFPIKNVIFLQIFVHKNVKYIDISLIKMYYF